MSPKKTKIIFFCAGPAPTEADHVAAEAFHKFRTTVVFRNAQLIVKGEALEKCDYVAGQVPALYVKTPHADSIKAAQVTPPAADVLGEGAVFVGVPNNETSPADKPSYSTPGTNEFAQEAVNFSIYSVKAVFGMIERKEITKERALLLEEAGQKRAPLLKALKQQ